MSADLFLFLSPKKSYLRINLRMLLTNLYPITIPSTSEIAFPLRIGVVMKDSGDNALFLSEIVVESLLKGTNRLAELEICSCCASILCLSFFFAIAKSSKERFLVS